MPSNFETTSRTGKGDITLTLWKHTATASAILVTTLRDVDTDVDGVWLPLSQISYHPKIDVGYISVDVPLWLAQAKGLA